MSKIRFVHCADVHLEAAFSSLGTERRLGSLRRHELKESFRRIIKYTKETKADFLLISGDLYEHAYATAGTFHFINGLFEEIPSTAVIILPGNHDPYGPNSGYAKFKWSPNVHILSPSNPRFSFREKGVCIFGLNEENGINGITDSNTGIDKMQLNGDPDDNSGHTPINILLFHGTVDLNIGDCSFNPRTSSDLAGLGMDYVASGHFHNRLDDIGGKGVVYNPGSPEPLGFGEEGVHGFYAATLEKNDTGVPKLDIEFIGNGGRRYWTLKTRIDGCNSDEKAASMIYDAIQSAGSRDTGIGLPARPDPSRDLFSVTVGGYVERGYGFNPRRVESMLGDRVFFVRIKDETEPDYDLDILSREPGLKGLFVRKMLERIGQATDGAERRRHLKALYFGLEALEGKIDVAGRRDDSCG